MSALTKNRPTPERVPALRQFVSGGKIYAGAIVAINSEGKAVAASSASGLVVVGRAENAVSAAGPKINVKSGCYLLKNSAGDSAVAATDIGKCCCIADDQTVSKTGSVVAGVVYDVASDGVWVRVGDDAVIGFADAPTAAEAIGDLALASVTGEAGSEVYAAGDASASLIADLLAVKNKLNAALAVLRANGFVASAE